MDARKLAVVTGGSSGIGRAIAVALASDGWNVVVQFGANRDGALDTQRAAEAVGAQCAIVSVDFAEVRSPQDFWGPVLAAADTAGLGREVHGLALNAGIDQRGKFEDYSLTDIEQIFHVNTFVPTLALQAAATHMPAGAAIAMTSSTGATLPIPTSVPYSMSKAAVNMLVAAGSKVLAEHHIRVNGVAPGIVDTPLQTRERIAAFADSGLVGSPADIAEVVAFVLSSRARWVNGEVITAAGNA